MPRKVVARNRVTSRGVEVLSSLDTKGVLELGELLDLLELHGFAPSELKIGILITLIPIPNFLRVGFRVGVPYGATTKQACLNILPLDILRLLKAKSIPIGLIALTVKRVLGEHAWVDRGVPGLKVECTRGNE
jgi:hypothetical protein